MSLWLTTEVYLLTSTPNLQTNTNIYSIHLAILYIQKKPFLSVLHSVYDVSALPTLRFILAPAQLTTYLLKRGYNRNFVNKQIRRAADMPRQLTLQTKDINKPKRIPFITTFNPSLPHISHIIKKHFNLLLSSHRCKSVFQHPPVVAFRRSPNLRDLLVTAKLLSILPIPNFLLVLSVVCKNCANLSLHLSRTYYIYLLLHRGELAQLNLTLLVKLKTSSTWFNVTAVIYNT